MSIKHHFFILGFVFLTLAANSTVSAFTSYEIVGLLHQNPREAIFKDYEAPLFPTEKEVEGLPTPIDSNETNVSVIEEYYRCVSFAYRQWGEKQLQKARQSDLKVKRKAAHLHLSHFRQNDKTSPTSFKNRETLKGAHYAQGVSKMLHIKADACFKKADFYEAMAETCAEIINEL